MAYTLLTGATGGLGKAFAVACAEKGYDLFLTGRSEEKLKTLQAELTELNPAINVLIFPADLTSESERNALLSFADNAGLSFDRLLNVAGVDTQKAFTAYTPEKVLFQLRVNVEATIALTHAVLARKAENLEILTVSSVSGASPMPYFALYSATKACLTNFFKSLRVELKGQGVKVSTLVQSGIYTRPDVVKDIKGQGLWGKMTAKKPEDVARYALKKLAKNKKTVTLGFWTKFMIGFLKILPEDLAMAFIAKRWKKQTKDAF